MRRLVAVCVSVALGVGGAALTAILGCRGKELKSGDPAPSFKLPGSDGKTYSLAELRGKTVVLAWFPKAFTGG